MAAMNIHESTGDNVPQSTLRLLVCKMLEEVSKERIDMLARIILELTLLVKSQYRHCICREK